MLLLAMEDLLPFCLRMDFFGFGEDEAREVEREEEEAPSSPPSLPEVVVWREVDER